MIQSPGVLEAYHNHNAKAASLNRMGLQRRDNLIHLSGATVRQKIGLLTS